MARFAPGQSGKSRRAEWGASAGVAAGGVEWLQRVDPGSPIAVLRTAGTDTKRGI
jgi:hypothetical protein